MKIGNLQNGVYDKIFRILRPNMTKVQCVSQVRFQLGFSVSCCFTDFNFFDLGGGPREEMRKDLPIIKEAKLATKINPWEKKNFGETSIKEQVNKLS